MRKSSIEHTLRDFYANMAIDITFLVKIEHARQIVKSVHEKQQVFEAYDCVCVICHSNSEFTDAHGVARGTRAS